MNTFTYLIIYLVICAAIALLVPIAKNKWSKYLSDFDEAYRDIGWGWWDDNQSLLSFKIGIVKVLTIIAFVLLTLLFFIFTPILLPLIAILDKKKALSEQGDDYANFIKLYNQTKPSDIKTVDKKAYFDSLVNLGNQAEQLSDRKVIEIEKVITITNENNTYNNLYFKEMSGGGIIRCIDCGYSEGIAAGYHGVKKNPMYDENIDEELDDFLCSNNEEYIETYFLGYQCQSCGKFYALEENDRLCDCGGVLERDKPIFCPKCKSKHVKYEGHWIT